MPRQSAGRIRRGACVLAATALAMMAGGAVDANAADEPPCPPEEVGDLFVPRGFVATRGDSHFEAGIRYDEGDANANGDSFTYSVPPPARVIVDRQEDSQRALLVAPEAGPLLLTVTWTQGPKSPRVTPPLCRATDTVLLLVMPVRVPAVRREPAEQPVAIGPTLTWPCSDETRTTDGPATIVVRYERGLDKAPGPSSPVATLELPSACALIKGRQKNVPGVLSLSSAAFRRERSRRALALFPARAGDLRVSINVSWGSALVFSHDYAIVSAGRRRDPDGRRTAVFLTTEPGAAVGAARRFARERRGAAYVSPEQRAERRANRAYRLSFSGRFDTRWAAGFGVAGEPGCGYVRETGADAATVSAAAFDPATGGGLRGRIDRSYLETRQCPLPYKTFFRPVCPQRGGFSGAASGAVVPDGGLMLDGRRARGARVTLGIFAELPGPFCVGWAGLLPSAVLDGPATGVSRLKIGQRATLPLSRDIDCRDALIETQGEPTACTVRVKVRMVVRRTR